MFGDNKYEIRELELKGASDTKWSWQKQDNGAWDGPNQNWNDEHFDRYFKAVGDRRGTVVTAGGNMGLHTRVYAETFEHVFVFEPDLENFVALVRNCQYDNVYFFRAALGPCPGWCQLSVGDPSNTGTHKVVWSDGGGSIPVMTIDQLILPQCDMIQLDVEGSEFAAILGSRETIEKHGPVIITERNDKQVINLLNKLGYSQVDKSASDFIYKKE